jgi:hypothetical protein
MNFASCEAAFSSALLLVRMPAAASPTTKHFDIRAATDRDFKRVLDFYKQHVTPALPAPTAKTVGDTIVQGRILLVEAHGTSEIVASGAVFELSPMTALTYVGELAGMRATRAVGGLQPVTMQALLLGLRLLGHVTTEPRVLRKGATNSIVATVHESNFASIRNIEGIGMKPLLERPGWFHYDELVWHGYVVGSEWKYYYADIDTILEVLRVLIPVGLLDREIRLTRIEKTTNQPEELRFHLQLQDVAGAEGDLREIFQSRTGVDLVAPPHDIAF